MNFFFLNIFQNFIFFLNLHGRSEIGWIERKTNFPIFPIFISSYSHFSVFFCDVITPIIFSPRELGIFWKHAVLLHNKKYIYMHAFRSISGSHFPVFIYLLFCSKTERMKAFGFGDEYIFVFKANSRLLYRKRMDTINLNRQFIMFQYWAVFIETTHQ